MVWFLAITGWLAAFSFIRRSRKPTPAHLQVIAERDEARAQRDEARDNLSRVSAYLIRARQDLGQEKKYRTDAEAELGQANEVNTGLVGDLAKVKAERDAALDKCDDCRAVLDPKGVPLSVDGHSN